MKPRTRITFVSSLLLLLSLAGSIAVLRPLDRLRANASLEEILYLPSPSVVKRLSFGFSGLMADVYWTRAVQYFGNQHYRNTGRYDLLYPLLDITTTLDPKMLVAYQFGSLFLAQQPPEGAGEPEKAVEIVNRGIAANPSEWRLYYNLGFIYYDMKDYANASRAFAKGAKISGGNVYLQTLAAATAQNSGSPETARLIWTQIYETSSDEYIRLGARKHLIAMQIDEDVPRLAKLVRDYAQRTGHVPGNFEEIVAAGWLPSVPRDPTGDEYQLLPDGRVEIRSPYLKPFVHYGLPGGPQGPPDSQTAATR